MLQINRYQQAKTFMHSYKILVAAIIFFIKIIAPSESHAQALTKLQNNFNENGQKNLQEKIYVHINKSFYITGEILWFKIYYAEGSNNQTLDISKVAYVDILDNSHTAVMKTKIALKGGKGNGSLYIPVSLANGHYILRAYTNWMKNFGPDGFFEQQITIINPLKVPAVQAKVTAPVFDVRFFPEGGHLVKGLASKVAYKVTGTDGIGVDCMGAIVDQKNDTVIRFKTLKFGIGSFMFTPLDNNTYRAVINVNNKTTVKDLPDISESGYVMQVNANNDGWDINMQNTADKQATGVYLLVHNRHLVNAAANISMVNGNGHLHISKEKVDDGLSYVTLFDDQLKPLCERLIFKRPAKELIVNSQSDQQVYNTRKKINLSISTQDQDHKPLSANLSVSVFKADSLQNAGENHIGSYLWLSSELKGHIDSADYYLKNTNEEANAALDNLLLSQGWTQFDWDKIASGKKPIFKFIPEYTGHIITGRITKNTDHLPVKDIIAYLNVPGTRQQLYTSKSDSTGRLLFNTHDFFGSSEVIVQTNPQTDSIYHIDITSPFSDEYSTVKTTPFSLSDYMENPITEGSFNMQVQNIFKADQLKQFYVPQIDSIPFYGTPAKSYLLDNYTRFTTIEEVLREYVSSIVVAKHQGKFNIRVFNGETPLINKPMVLLDGMPVFDLDKIFAMDPLKIKKLDVVSTDYLYGPVIFNGIMSFATYKGDMGGFEIDPHAVIVDYEGLQLARKFYSPVYDTNKQINSTIPDFRNVLYWNPDADTDQQGKSNLTFYTSDKPGKYRVVIEGNSANGYAGSQSFTFDVKK